MRRCIAALPLFVALIAWIGLAVASPAPGAGPGAAHPGHPPPPKKPSVRSITISSDPNPSMVDQQVVVSGQLRGRKVGGLRVTLWRKGPLDRRFHVELTTRADSDGNYVIAV